jgi:hypothetical protein
MIGTYKSVGYQVNRSIHVGGGFSDTECGALQRSHDLRSVAILNLRKFRKLADWHVVSIPITHTQNMPRAGNNQSKISARLPPSNASTICSSTFTKYIYLWILIDSQIYVAVRHPRDG